MDDLDTTTKQEDAPIGMLNQREWASMLAAFVKMSPHDQATIYRLILDRADAAAHPRERGI